MKNIFDNGSDDYMFPTTARGLLAVGVMESACGVDGENEEGKQGGAVNEGENGKGGAGVFQNAGVYKSPLGILEDAVTALARGQARAKAMAAVLDWIANGDFSYDALDELIAVVADIDGDYEISDEEEDVYNDIWAEAPDALLTLGGELEDVQSLVDGPGKESDDAAARLGKHLEKEMEGIEADDDDLIASFAAGEDAVLESAQGDSARIGILEATYKRRKVVRGGKVQIVRKRVSGKVRLSAAQKAGLRKARRKSHTASANLARRKSNRMRKRRGLNK